MFVESAGGSCVVQTILVFVTASNRLVLP